MNLVYLYALAIMVVVNGGMDRPRDETLASQKCRD